MENEQLSPLSEETMKLYNSIKNNKVKFLNEDKTKFKIPKRSQQISFTRKRKAKKENPEDNTVYIRGEERIWSQKLQEFILFKKKKNWVDRLKKQDSLSLNEIQVTMKKSK